MMRVFLIGVLIVATSSCSGGEKAQLPVDGAAVSKTAAPSKKVEAPAKKLEETELRLIGEVSSQEKILLSFKVSANIDKMLVKTGSKVKKGQVLAELDSTTYRLLDAAAKLQLERADNLLAQAQRDFKIEEDLRNQDISSAAQFQNAELAYKNAVVNQKLAEVEMHQKQNNLQFTRLIAPVDGTISQQFKFVGDLSTGGDAGGASFEMFALADPEIYLSAPESLLTKLSVDTNLDVNFPAIGLRLPAKIVRIVPIIRESDRSFLVVAKLREKNSRIIPGLFAEGLVKEARK